MVEVCLAHPVDLDGWRRHARALLAQGISPEAVAWRVEGEAADLFAGPPSEVRTDQPTMSVPRRFVEFASSAICHRDPARFALLYRVLWRIGRGERRLLDVAADADGHRLRRLADAVRRDAHKMTAFVRFRRMQVDGNEHFVAWFEPRHHVVERTAPFFVRRFAAMRWSILTPDRSAHWDGETLRFAPGVARAEATGEDGLEDLWRRYYAAIFNPARLNLRAMRAQMPQRYWRNLPEARLITPLATAAAERTRAMLAAHPEPVGRTRRPQRGDG